jgi:hypothetical protein
VQLANKRGMNFLKRPVLVLNILSVFLSFNSLHAQEPFKIFLIGDAGDHEEAGEALTNIQKELIKSPNSAVVFLGDKSYKNILGKIIPVGFK